MRAKTIGFLLGSLNGAGAEKTVLTLAGTLARLGHRVDLLLLDQGGDYTLPPGVRAVAVAGQDFRGRAASLAQLSAAGGYDLFVTTRAEYHDALQVANRLCSVHITPTAWIRHPRWQFWKTAHKLYRLRRKFQGKRLIALSRGIAADLTDRLGCRAQDVTVINNPFEIAAIRAAGDAPGPLPEGPYMIYVASLIERKRHADLFRAFAALHDRSIALVLLGKGREEARLRRLAGELGIAGRVEFRGWDANPYRLIRHARLSLLASEAEGLPRVVVESLLLGTPVVSTDCPSGPAEVLQGALADFLVPVGDVAALGAAIERALQDYPRIDTDRLAHFDAEAVARRYLALIPEQDN